MVNMGVGVLLNLRFYLRKIEGRGKEEGAVSPKGKQKELEVFPYGPLYIFSIVRMCLNQNALFIVYAHLAAFGRYPDNIPLYIISTYKYM